VVALDNASYQLRQEADLYMSGYLVPNLVPIDDRIPRRQGWGEIGSRVRGTCYWYELERGFGYMRFLTSIGPGLWLTDARHPDSPYDTAFFRIAHLPPEVRSHTLPSRNVVFEFELSPSEKGEGLQAVDITVAGSSRSFRPPSAARSGDDHRYQSGDSHRYDDEHGFDDDDDAYLEDEEHSHATADDR
ncbi:MAG: hypothetical protein AAGD38_24965, partial [Acidobacteriota bacterium]